MSEGLARVRAGNQAQLGLPKWAKRVWPFEEGVQGPDFWRREEEMANQHVRTSIAREIAAHEAVEDMRGLLHFNPTNQRMSMVLDAYDIRIKEIYTAHRKAIRAIKDMYPGIR